MFKRKGGENPERPQIIPDILASVGIVIGLLSISGWILHLPLLASFGSAIPMAPSTAVLFITFGLLVYFLRRLKYYSFLFWIQIVFVLAFLAVSVILFYASLHGIHFSAEHLGLPISQTIESIPLGHISPITAFLFVLSDLGLLMLIVTLKGSNKIAIVAFILACIIIFTGIVLILAYLTGAPVLYGTAFIPPALSTAISFVTMGMALMSYSNNYAWISVFPVENVEKRLVKYLVGTFSLLFIGIAIAGYLYFKGHVIRYREGVENHLSGIAASKVSRIVEWKNEQYADAAFIYNNMAFAALAGNILDKKESEDGAVKMMSSWLRQLKMASGYEAVRLMDITGRVLIQVPDPQVRHSLAFAEWLQEVGRDKKIVFHDLFRETSSDPIYMTILVPVLRNGTKDMIGIVELQINPNAYLYPVINNWPAPDKTSESILLRKKDNKPFILNEPRFGKGTSFIFQRSDTTIDWLADQFAPDRRNIAEGIDYRRKEVIAHIIHVPETPWYLISKIDKSEVLSKLMNRMWGTLILIGTLLITTVIMIVFIWRNQHNRNYRDKYQTLKALHESTEKFIKAFQNKSVFMSILKVDGTYVDVNDFSFGFLGYTPMEMIGSTNESLGLFPEEDTMEQIRKSMLISGHIHNREVRLQTRQGALRYGNMSIEKLRSGVEELWLFIVVDITSFKLAEERILKLNRVYAVLSEVNRSIVRIRNPKELYEKACRIAVDKGELSMAWIGLLDEETGKLLPVAFAGNYQNYLEHVITTMHETTCEYCPIEKSLRTGGYYHCEISGQLSGVRTCMKEAMVHGFQSVISFALKVNDKVRGTISFYSGEPDFFNEEEIRLLEEISLDISFFMEFNELEVKRHLAGVALSESEKRLQLLNNELEERVRERTAELDSINKELESFAYSISHDLRAPLRVISGFSSFLQDDYSKQLDAEGIRLLSIIVTSTRRMDQLINDILAVSKISRKEIKPQPIDMNALAHLVFNEISGEEQRKKILFVVEDIPPVQADMVLMKQLWFNLISNSIKYTSKKDNPEITITGKSEGNINTYSIIDNGAGFDQNYSYKLFNLFQRLHSLEEFEGTGVGLTIVKRIVDRFGGNIRAESSPGNGAFFCFTLSNMDTNNHHQIQAAGQNMML